MPLWIGHQKVNLDFPIYKFKVSKELHTIDEEKWSKRDSWQSMKLHSGSDKEMVERILKVKKREWIWEYATLLESNEDQKSFQSLTNHRNLVQVYEQFNWLVWAVCYFYFENTLDPNTFGLPPHKNDAWVEGFMWKGVYFRIVPWEQLHFIKQEIEALKHITLELDEWFSLEEKYQQRFDLDTSESYHKRIIPPLLSISECGSFAIYGTPEIPILKSGKSSPTISIQNLQNEHNLDLSNSMLQLMPCLSKLTPSNLVPLNIDGLEEKYMIVNWRETLQPYYPEIYSKWIIRIPQEISEEISIYQYPSNGSILLEDLVSLFVEGKIEDKNETPRSSKRRDPVDRKNIRECNFTAHGWKIKILLYDQNKNFDTENERAKAVFMSRDERIFSLAALKSKPNTKDMVINDLLTHTIVGEPEIIDGDVLLVVEQVVNPYILPYSLTYNKPAKKPELYIERAIDRAREILEESNDICSDIAFNEFLLRKGMNLSSVWIFAALIKSNLIKQLCRCIILSNAIKRLIDKEIFIWSDIEVGKKIPLGVYKEKEGVICLNYQQKLIYVIESIMKKAFNSETKLFKNLLMILFFYRLESLQFHNTLQFEVGTKDYLQGKFILDDIIHVPSENPTLFLKTLQNVWNCSFSLELLRKSGIDKYSLVHADRPMEVANIKPTEAVTAVIKNYAPVSIRERVYFVMAKFISTKEYVNLNDSKDDYTKHSGHSDSVRNSYLDEDDEEERDYSDEAENESYDSVASLNNEDSPPFKQAKFDRTDHKNLLNSVYSSRMSMISNHDNVLRASHSGMNLNKNFIDGNNNRK